MLILQHPLEVHNPKGSARLLHLSLPGSRLVAGETFDDLPALLAQPCADKNSPRCLECQCCSTHKRRRTSRKKRGNSTQCPKHWHPGIRNGTIQPNYSWCRVGRHLAQKPQELHCNPQLLQLPRLALKDMPASRYRVHRAHRADQLSTLEAICAALAEVHGGCLQYAPLLAAFDGFVAQQLGNRSH